MARPVKLLLVSTASLAAAAVVAACGTEQIGIPKSQGATYQGAVLFNQRCSGCHTLSYASTHGSAANVRTAEYNNGPNFDQRCERPVTRVLYAIENGGFSGAIMPQNIVVGEQAIEVAKFVSTYAGRKAPQVPGVNNCQQKDVGTVPALSGSGTAAATAQAKQAGQVQSNKAQPSKSAAKAKGKSGHKARAKPGAKKAKR